MQRDIRNEIYIAIGTIVIISFALLFAILLAGSPEGEISATDTPSIQIITPTLDTSDVTETATGTNTSVPRASDTDTPENTATTIALEPTVATDTPVPTASDTDTPKSTATDIALEATVGATDTPEATVQNTSTPEATDVPSVTATRISTLSPSPTMINVASGIIPTLPSSPTVAPPNEPTRTPASCQQPQGWTTYVVQSGDTLFAIALATRSTVDELRHVNCIANIDNITADDRLFIPRPPSHPITTPHPSGGREGLIFIGCTDFRTQITNLIAGQRVQGTFIVQGSAFRDDFWYFKIEIRPDWADIYNFYSDSNTPVSNGVLGEVNSDIFGEGLHWVRLSVVDLSAGIQSDAICEIPVIFG